jgi:hypothetical protein
MFCAVCVAMICDLYAGTVITNNLPTNVAIINIDARADGSAGYNGDQSLWYRPVNTGGTLLQYTVSAGGYNFRVIDPVDAVRFFPALTPQQTNEIYTAWTFNAPWATDYLVFDSAAATNASLPQLFDGAFSNTNGGASNWHFYSNATDAYNAAISQGYADLLRTSVTGGRDSTTFTTSYVFNSPATLIFVIPDNGLFDNSGGVSVLVTPVGFLAGRRLSIEAAPPNTVRLLWPTNDPAFHLQSTTNLDGVGWTVASPSPTIVGANNVVTNSTSEAHRFYRLIKP